MCDVISFGTFSTSFRGRRPGACAEAADRAGQTVGRHAACSARVDHLEADRQVCRARASLHPGASHPRRVAAPAASREAGRAYHPKAYRGEERPTGPCWTSSTVGRREADRTAAGWIRSAMADRRGADRTVDYWICPATADRRSAHAAAVGWICSARADHHGADRTAVGWICPARADRRVADRTVDDWICPATADRRSADGAAVGWIYSARVDRLLVDRRASPCRLACHARGASRAAARTSSPRPLSS